MQHVGLGKMHSAGAKVQQKTNSLSSYPDRKRQLLNFTTGPKWSRLLTDKGELIEFNGFNIGNDGLFLVTEMLCLGEEVIKMQKLRLVS